MLTDPGYRKNQADSQRAWLDRNPDYWREYRAKGGGNATGITGVPVDEPKVGPPYLSGLYRLRCVESSDLAKSDAWVVEITPVCLDCPCKKDVCKDRT
jgi:hypothetical protein